MYRFRNTLIAFIVSTAFTIPIFIAMNMNQASYETMVALLGSTWPPITPPWGLHNGNIRAPVICGLLLRHAHPVDDWAVL